MTLTQTNATSSRTIAILDRVAAAEDAPVEDLPPLYDAIDPESLETLLESGEVTVTFAYHGYYVTATSNGTIFVIPERDVDADA